MFQFCSLASLSIAERVSTKPAHHTPEPSATKNQMHHHISAITPAQRTAHHELKQQKQQKQRERGQAGTRRQAAHVRAPTGRCSLALYPASFARCRTQLVRSFSRWLLSVSIRSHRIRAQIQSRLTIWSRRVIAVTFLFSSSYFSFYEIFVVGVFNSFDWYILRVIPRKCVLCVCCVRLAIILVYCTRVYELRLYVGCVLYI